MTILCLIGVGIWACAAGHPFIGVALFFFCAAQLDYNWKHRSWRDGR